MIEAPQTTAILLIIAAYLAGSISSAIIVCRVMGLPDPRSKGSGNPGATNMLRVGGKKTAAITLVGDLLKGLLAVLAAHLLGASLWVVALTGLAAFLGHLYPLFFGFKGGKGVATLIGVLLGVDWRLGLAAVATWLLVIAFAKIAAISALVMAALVPVYGWYFYQHTAFTCILAAMSLLLFWRHRSNIRNIISGKEYETATAQDIEAD